MVSRTVVATGAGLAGAGVLGAGLAYALSRGRASQIILPLFFAGGLTLSQAWQTYLVRQRNWDLKGFPHLDVPAWLGYAYLPVLAGFAFVLALWVTWRTDRPTSGLLLLLLPVAVSQLFGRGLIRGGFDTIYWMIVVVSFLIGRGYPAEALHSLPPDRARFLYAELWEMLKIGITLGTFYVGTVGVAFAIQFLKEQYFKAEPNAPWQMYRYGTLFIYSLLGMIAFVARPLIERIAILRKALL